MDIISLYCLTFYKHINSKTICSRLLLLGVCAHWCWMARRWHINTYWHQQVRVRLQVYEWCSILQKLGTCRYWGIISIKKRLGGTVLFRALLRNSIGSRQSVSQSGRICNHFISRPRVPVYEIKRWKGPVNYEGGGGGRSSMERRDPKLS